MAECLRLVIWGRMQCDIIITVDADELIEPNYFELLYWALYYYPEVS